MECVEFIKNWGGVKSKFNFPIFGKLGFPTFRKMGT